MGKRAAISQADLTRYAKALRAAGFQQFRVIVDPVTGKHEIVAGTALVPLDDNPWDRLEQ